MSVLEYILSVYSSLVISLKQCDNVWSDAETLAFSLLALVTFAP